jgi:hypothetical protein
MQRLETSRTLAAENVQSYWRLYFMALAHIVLESKEGIAPPQEEGS